MKVNFILVQKFRFILLCGEMFTTKTAKRNKRILKAHYNMGEFNTDINNSLERQSQRGHPSTASFIK